jgi:hypothetical protein
MSGDTSIEDIIRPLRSFHKNFFPAKALRRASMPENRDAVLAVIGKTFEEISLDPRKGLEGRHALPFFSVLLCAKHRASEIKGAFMSFLRLDDKILDVLLGDLLTEYVGMTLSYMCEGDADVVKTLFEDKTACDTVRIEAASCLNTWYVRGILSREELAAYYRQRLSSLEGESHYYISMLLMCFMDLYPSDDKAAIKEIIDSGRTDRFLHTDDEYEALFSSSEEEVLAATRKKYSREINDIVEMLRKWSWGGDVKLSRNTICPCGSGKKYKACCME